MDESTQGDVPRFMLPGEPGAAIRGTLDLPGIEPIRHVGWAQQPVPQPVANQSSPSAKHVGPGGHKGASLDPTRHIPIAIATKDHLGASDAEHHQPDVVVMDGPAVQETTAHANAKFYYFGYDVYIYLVIGLLLRVAVFLALAFAGSRSFAGVYAATFFLEALMFVMHSLRDKPGGRKVLTFELLIARTFILVSLTYLVLSCLTRVIHFEEGWARWVAVSLSALHTLVYLGLCIALANTIQAKKRLTINAMMIQQSTELRSGPGDLPVSSGSESKVKSG